MWSNWGTLTNYFQKKEHATIWLWVFLLADTAVEGKYTCTLVVTAALAAGSHNTTDCIKCKLRWGTVSWLLYLELLDFFPITPHSLCQSCIHCTTERALSIISAIAYHKMTKEILYCILSANNFWPLLLPNGSAWRAPNELSYEEKNIMTVSRNIRNAYNLIREESSWDLYWEVWKRNRPPHPTISFICQILTLDQRLEPFLFDFY